MSWIRLDDGFADHQKVLDIGETAFRLHVCAMCWAGRRLTDGLIKARDLPILMAMLKSPPANQMDPVNDLLAAGLWTALEAGTYSLASKDRSWRIDAPRPHRKRPYLRHRKLVYDRDGRRCRYCRLADNLSLDHLQPPRLGGTHDPDNLVTCCRPCNSRKGSRTPEQAGMRLLPIGGA